MKSLRRTFSILLSITLSAYGQSNETIQAQIELKEKELARLKAELSTLKEGSAHESATTQIKRYVVKTGDTMSSIARRHKVSVANLLTWNQISDPNRLSIGTELVIKSSLPQDRPQRAPQNNSSFETAPPNSRNYTIRTGDTFYSIARKHKISVKELQELNPSVSSNDIKVGDPLQVSRASQAPSAPKAPAPQQVISEAFRPTAPTPPAIQEKDSTLPAAVVIEEPKVDTPPMKTEDNQKKAASTEGASSSETTQRNSPQSDIETIILEEEITFAQFAERHHTTTEQLNSLNGWNLPKATVLASGSEIHVPNRAPSGSSSPKQ